MLEGYWLTSVGGGACGSAAVVVAGMVSWQLLWQL
jgi:hypothetical protein